MATWTRRAWTDRTACCSISSTRSRRHAYRVTDEQVQGLRDAGWSDEQIAEAAYDAALFNLFVRLADTFGIEPPAVYEPERDPASA